MMAAHDLPRRRRRGRIPQSADDRRSDGPTQGSPSLHISRSSNGTPDFTWANDDDLVYPSRRSAEQHHSGGRSGICQKGSAILRLASRKSVQRIGAFRMAARQVSGIDRSACRGRHRHSRRIGRQLAATAVAAVSGEFRDVDRDLRAGLDGGLSSKTHGLGHACDQGGAPGRDRRRNRPAQAGTREAGAVGMSRVLWLGHGHG
jgi:hypothetical protein